MEYPIVLIPYTDTPGVEKETPAMKTQTQHTVLMTKPQPTPGMVKVYLLPKAVADFNKTHGKTYVV